MFHTDEDGTGFVVEIAGFLFAVDENLVVVELEFLDVVALGLVVVLEGLAGGTMFKPFHTAFS